MCGSSKIIAMLQWMALCRHPVKVKCQRCSQTFILNVPSSPSFMKFRTNQYLPRHPNPTNSLNPSLQTGIYRVHVLWQIAVYYEQRMEIKTSRCTGREMSEYMTHKFCLKLWFYIASELGLICLISCIECWANPSWSPSSGLEESPVSSELLAHQKLFNPLLAHNCQ